MNRATTDPDDDSHDAVLALLRWSARRLVADPDPQAFIAALSTLGPQVFPELLQVDAQVWRMHQAKSADEGAADAARLFRSLGWAIASAMPLPSQDFRARKLPLPGRNDPCLCGSLQKYKHCCAHILPAMPSFDAGLMGALVIEALPRKRWAELPQTRCPAALVVAAADLLSGDDRQQDAVRLLEPWAKLPPPWPDSHADLLDLLGDLYLDLDKPRKRKQLAQRMVEHGTPAVQAKGWQRLALLATDVGDAAAGWAAFEKAQRLAPDDPSLAVLEVTLLHGSGEAARARERAAFHARRLARLPQAEQLADSIDTLQDLARVDSPLSQRLEAAFGPPDLSVFTALERWLAAAPQPPRLRLTLPSGPCSDLGELQATAAAGRALRQWREAFAVQAPLMAWDSADVDLQAVLASSDRWWPVLQAQPLLADCFEFIDDLLLFLDGVPFGLAGGSAALLKQRALVLWGCLRDRQPAALCEWGHLGNRPALRLLARIVHEDDSPTAKESFEWLRHLVQVLNPHDNHGLRNRLAAVYLWRGDAAAALTLCERYPDDRAGMTLLHARALLALQRLDEAAAMLHKALKRNPHVQALLLGKRAPRVPDVPSYALGSVEEARIALAPQFDLWHSDPVVQRWLREQFGAQERRHGTADLFAPDEP